jgi:uncharacterized membrane protein
MAHAHGHGIGGDQRSSWTVRALLGAAVGACGLATIAALVVLWPSHRPQPKPQGDLATMEYDDATVTTIDRHPCGSLGDCDTVTIHLDSGTDAGATRALPDLQAGPSTPELKVDDKVVVTRVQQKDTGEVNYNFQDLQRTRPLWLLGAITAAVVVLIGRWRGLAAIAGLGVTWAVLIGFLIPALLDGANPVAVAVTSGSAILFTVLYLAHGISARTTTALLGTMSSLGLTAILAAAFVAATRLSGTSSEEGTYLVASGINIDLRGLLLCAIIIGSLGALNDVTVTQASAVWEVHNADPTQSARQLYRAGMRIGRDHIASTVDTLVLAYAGSSLPLLTLFLLADQRIGDVVTTEIVAAEVVRTLVGTIGLVTSVPVTTMLACVVVKRNRSLTGAAVVIDLPAELDPDADTIPRAPVSLWNRDPDTPERTRARREADRRARADTWDRPAHEREFWDT